MVDLTSLLQIDPQWSALVDVLPDVVDQLRHVRFSTSELELTLEVSSCTNLLP